MTSVTVVKHHTMARDWGTLWWDRPENGGPMWRISIPVGSLLGRSTLSGERTLEVVGMVLALFQCRRFRSVLSHYPTQIGPRKYDFLHLFHGASWDYQ